MDDEPTHVGGGYSNDAMPTVVPTATSAPTIAGSVDVPREAYRPPLPANLPAAGMPVYTPAPDPYLERVIAGRYHVSRKLGEGGMGAVYLATHVTLEKEVALKILHSELARKPELVERFLQEAKAASRIRHANVIDITDFGATEDGAVFFAMEVLEGHDLHDVITRARYEGQAIPWQRSRAIFAQVCAALSAAHARGVIHRDLKPENIYLVERLDNPDHVKLLDFGIAKLTEVAEGERKLTRTGMLFGTPEYMSPEQARGDKVDHRVDVYAMGCILYQLIVGRVPFEADNFMGVLSRHLSDPAPLIPEDRLAQVGAPASLNHVIQCALAKDRNERFSSIDDLVRAIEAAERGALVMPAVADTAAVPGAPIGGMRAREATYGVVRAQPKKSRALLWAALAVILAGGAAGGAAAILGKSGSKPAAARDIADAPASLAPATAPASLAPATAPATAMGATPPDAGVPDATVPDATVPDAAAPDAAAVEKKRDKKRRHKDSLGDPKLKDPFGNKKP